MGRVGVGGGGFATTGGDGVGRNGRALAVRSLEMELNGSVAVRSACARATYTALYRSNIKQT